MTPIRIAVIGVGYLGQIHTRLLAGDDQFELVGVVDPSAGARQEMAREHGVAVFSDFRQLQGQAEAAVVATPTILHHEVTSHLLQNGVHVLVEKPLGLTGDDAKQITDAAADAARKAAQLSADQHQQQAKDALRDVVDFCIRRAH